MNFSIFALFLPAIIPASTGIVSGWIGPYKPMLSEQDSGEFSQEDHPRSPIAFDKWIQSTNGLLLVGIAIILCFSIVIVGSTMLLGVRTKVAPKVYKLKEFTKVPFAEEAFCAEKDDTVYKPTVEEA